MHLLSCEYTNLSLPSKRFAAFFRHPRPAATDVFICRQQNGIAQHFIPKIALISLLPDVLCDHFEFWATTSSTILGEPRDSGFFQNRRVKLTQFKVEMFESSDYSQSVRLCTDSSNPLRSVLARFEPLAQCLIWKDDTGQVVLVEMPRHELRYRLDAHGELVSGDKTLLQHDERDPLPRRLPSWSMMLPSFLVNHDSAFLLGQS